jgi:hypothetical protein
MVFIHDRGALVTYFLGDRYIIILRIEKMELKAPRDL